MRAAMLAQDCLSTVIELDPQGRPPLEEVGVTFTDHVHAHEAMKIRMLNGGHAIIAYPGGLMDIEHVHEAMAQPLILGLLDKVEREEIIPYVPPVSGTDRAACYAPLRDHFANPEVADTERRLCLDGSNRQPRFIVPSLRDALAAGGSIEGLALECPLWCRYCAGTTDSGTMIAPNDPNWDMLQTPSLKAREPPPVRLGMASVYGDLGRNPRLTEAPARHLNSLWARGTAATLAGYIG